MPAAQLPLPPAAVPAAHLPLPPAAVPAAHLPPAGAHPATPAVPAAPAARPSPPRAGLGLVPVPPFSPGVCPVCHGYRRRGFARCTGCERVLAQVRRPCLVVVPISLAPTGTGSGLYRLLRDYKDGRRSEAERAVAAGSLAVLVDAFLSLHRRCIAPDPSRGWDSVAVVPSTGSFAAPAGGASEQGHRRPPGAHPLHLVVERCAALGSLAPIALARSTGRLGHLRASDDGFCCGPSERPIEGRRVLLLDDTYTSGARCQSAASALAGAGATVVAVVVIARLVRPGFVAGRAYWRRQRSSVFDPARCCLELPAALPGRGRAT